MEDEKERGSMISKMEEILEEILMVEEEEQKEAMRSRMVEILEEILMGEEEEKEAMRSRMMEILAFAPVDVVVSWTGRRCSETGGSRMVKLTEAWHREGGWIILVSGLDVK